MITHKYLKTKCPNCPGKYLLVYKENNKILSFECIQCGPFLFFEFVGFNNDNSKEKYKIYKRNTIYPLPEKLDESIEEIENMDNLLITYEIEIESKKIN